MFPNIIVADLHRNNGTLRATMVYLDGDYICMFKIQDGRDLTKSSKLCEAPSRTGNPRRQKYFYASSSKYLDRLQPIQRRLLHSRRGLQHERSTP